MNAIHNNRVFVVWKKWMCDIVKYLQKLYCHQNVIKSIVNAFV
jgi:hypothetical protein